MKLKPTVMLQGTVMQPLMTGRKAHYCQNGFWKTTGNVVCVLEQDDTHVNLKRIRFVIVSTIFMKAPEIWQW